jgi:hypothetical protein
MKRETALEYGYISETLYHFLPNDFRVFTLIVEKGLLCSVGNKGKLDRFEVTLKEEGITTFDVWQHPRVCFTDIPRGYLSVHAAKYGGIGLGFTRETILDWGGSPVWYVNNRASRDGTSDNGAILHGLHRFGPLIDILMREVKLQNKMLKFHSGREMRGKEAESYLKKAISSLYQMFSFVKEIFPADEDDPDYLSEREWRIVADGTAAFPPPTAHEKRQLIKQNGIWGCPPETTDSDILSRFGKRPMVEEFCYFRGTPGEKAISQAIEVILVPDERVKARIARFIAKRPESFRTGGPDISVFPGTATAP